MTAASDHANGSTVVMTGSEIRFDYPDEVDQAFAAGKTRAHEEIRHAAREHPPDCGCTPCDTVRYVRGDEAVANLLPCSDCGCYGCPNPVYGEGMDNCGCDCSYDGICPDCGAPEGRKHLPACFDNFMRRRAAKKEARV